MTFLLIAVALIIGGFIGALIERGETCPRAVLGYNCRGYGCDHSESVLYEAKATMARNRENATEHNYWKGDNDA